MTRVVAVSGASDGIGKACADRFAAEGWKVYDLSRHGQSREGVEHITADVTDPAAVNAAFDKIKAEQGRLDVCIANAGFGISGAAEFTDPEAVKRLFAVNVLGADNCARAAIPLLRESRGKIIFTSSVAGELSIPFQTYYSATKAAVNSLACGLANELRPFGIKVCALMLGDAKTGFTAKREKQAAGSEFYGQRIERSVAQMEKDEQSGMSPAVIARAYYRTAISKNPKVKRGVGATYRLFLVIDKLLPIRLINRLLYMLYAK